MTKSSCQFIVPHNRLKFYQEKRPCAVEFCGTLLFLQKQEHVTVRVLCVVHTWGHPGGGPKLQNLGSHQHVAFFFYVDALTEA